MSICVNYNSVFSEFLHEMQRGLWPHLQGLFTALVEENRVDLSPKHPPSVMWEEFKNCCTLLVN